MKKWIYFIPILLLFGVIYAMPIAFNEKGNYESFSVRDFHEGLPLTEEENTIFIGSGACEFCHGEGALGPNPDANLDLEGNDISPVSLWQSTMMANASKDPFWQAKVSHEKLVNPEIEDEIESTCLKCHAPMGTFNAMHHEIHYSLDSMKNDPLGLDGVSCLACHAMASDNLGSVFSANMQYDTNHMVYGQYADPLTMPMEMNIGYTPVLGEHVSSSEACGACHTLITHPVNEFGESLDTFFVEQAIYHEWLNSAYATTNETCQDCHMPKIDDFGVVISNRPPWLDERPLFAKHDLVGGNAFMLEMLRDNIDTLNLNASTSDFDLTLSKTLDMLENKSMESSLEISEIDADSITYAFSLRNLAGHKLPGGYPSRRLVVEFLIQTPGGDTLFHSGKFNSDFSVVEEDYPYEGHYDIIRNESEVQIYEMVMNDYVGNMTTVLEYAYTSPKDNRLVPEGFSVDHPSYDTVRIVGNATSDLNFNLDNTGTDIIHYKVPNAPNSEEWIVTGRVFYQTVTPKWLEEMFSFSSEEIDLFRYLYENANTAPTLISHAQINGFANLEEESIKINIYPNPSKELVQIESSETIRQIQIYTLSGKQIFQKNYDNAKVKIKQAELTGTFIVRVTFDDNKSIIRKIQFE